jgi:hypothetical protein
MRLRRVLDRDIESVDRPIMLIKEIDVGLTKPCPDDLDAPL